MKKLMMAAAIVCAAAFANAATVNWKMDECTAHPGEDTYVAQGTTVYLIQAMNGATEVHTQDAFISALSQAASLAAFEETISGWKVASTVTSDGYGDWENYGLTTTLAGGSAATAYYAIVDTDADMVFMSTEIAATYTGVGEVYTVIHTSDDYDASVAAAMKASAGNQGAGWYTAQAVPEPTSGLLLLLGVAGLAIRRRRA